MKRTFTITLLAVLLLATTLLSAQTFTPVPVTGYNNDIIAEAGLTSLAGTSTVIDGSNHVIHTAAFAAANGVGGGITNTGTIVSGTRTYQLAPYNGNNAIYMSSAGNVPNTVGTGTFTLTTPKAYSVISLLAFGTENNSVVGVTLKFTDGTTAAAGNITIKDWFGGSPFLISGFGRLTRVAASPTVDGLSSDPRMYAFDFPVPCASQGKLLQTITFSYIPGPNPSSRALMMAISAADFTPLTYSAVVTDAICGGANGKIALTINSGSTPVTFAWNTNPTQTGATANNLPAGNYTANIKDANNCITTYQGTVVQKSSASITASGGPTAICSGEVANLTATATGASVSDYAWNPGNIAGSNAAVTPTDTTDYIVTAKDAFGCVVADTITVAVKPTPTADFTLSTSTICLGAADTANFKGVAGPAAAFNWDNFAGATFLEELPGRRYAFRFQNAGTHTMQLQVTDDGCKSAIYKQEIVVSAPPAVMFQVSKTPLCEGEITTVSFTGTASASAIPTWTWGGGVPQSGTGLGPYNVRYTTNGIINLTINDGACSAQAPAVPVTVIPMPVADFEPDALNGCAPAVFRFTNNSSHADAYAWTLGDGSTSTLAAPEHTYANAGTYTIRLIASAQKRCADTIVKTGLLNVVPPPVAAFSSSPPPNNPVEYKNATFDFVNGSTNATSYTWSFGDGNTSAAFNPTYKWEFPGSYWVTLTATNSLGCVDSVGHGLYHIIPDLLLDIPNVFSPNGDGINDRWNIDGLKARPGCRIEVFNRWGQLVYKSEGYTVGWDGTRNGAQVAQGTYYYVVKTAPGEKTYTGWVVLLR